MTHFADRLIAVVRDRGNAVCVGLDPRWESLPVEVKTRYQSGTLEGVAGAYREFCYRVLDVVAPMVPVVKPQSAFFEAAGPAGMTVLQQVIRRARELGLIVLLDGKRNDIASTAGAYADAALGRVRVDADALAVWDAEACTVNPYLGRDAVEPFLQAARREHRGVFILVRTSNPGSGMFQNLVCEGRPLFLHVADRVQAWTRENLGISGYGDVGAVVGATHAAELADVRVAAPETLFLIPGYGSQGGTAAATAPAFRTDGLGAVVSSSREIIFAFRPEDRDWERSVEAATKKTIEELRRSTNMQALAKALTPSD